MRIALYTRVSKDDETQDPQNQVVPLREFAKALNGEIVREYMDYASGGKSDRKQFKEMLGAAEKREFDLLLVWALDRFSREGIVKTLKYLERLKLCGVAMKSLQESWLDTRDDGLGELMLAILSWVAKQERKRISERTKAGLQKALRNGSKLGRPKGAKDKGRRKRSGYWEYWKNKTKKRANGPDRV